jgi:iron-only hydrogenase group A
MITIEVNNKKIEAKPGEYLLAALKRANLKVPTFCNIDGLTPSGACRICSVEVEGIPGTVPACAFPVYEGMKVQTHSPKIINARKTILELLLSNHPDDCLYCVRNNNCELQTIATELGVSERRFYGEKNNHKLDTGSPAIIRDPAKCILCGKCVRVCEEIQSVSAIEIIGRGSKAFIGTAYNEGLNISSCINCGQCINICPTAALTEQSHIQDVLEAIHNPKKVVIVQHAPSVSVTVGEEFGLKAGTDVNGLLTSAMRRMGFDYVFETSYSADLTIMEEASELVHRIQNGGALPMMTSCSPGWVKFMEQFYPEMLDNLSTCKSPQEMLGAIIKSYFAEKMNIPVDNIYSVSVMPCTAKKFEAGRPELTNNGVPDIDAVLTVREFTKLIKMMGIDFKLLEPEYPDNPFGERTSAGKLFGSSGGVMEAALRTAHYFLTGKEMDNYVVNEVRGPEGIKLSKVNVAGKELSLAVVSGLGNARKLISMIKEGKIDVHFVEVMSCPGGCINGGGMPIGACAEDILCRMKTLYKIDKEERINASHKNSSINRLYEEYLGAPLGEKSHHLLHTHYQKRDVLI